MLMTELIVKLSRNDARLIGRDSFLILLSLFALVIAIVLRGGLPWLNNYLIDNRVLPGGAITISLADIYPMLVAYMALYTGALMVGTVFGFVLLDEKDQNTLRAMLVTPVPLNKYVLYRVGAPVLLAFVLIIVMVFIINQAMLPVWQVVVLAAASSLTAPIASLFYAVFAENKVQGFAYSKFGGIFGLFIMFGWFIPEPWQWLLGVFPPFWVAKAYWLALAGSNSWWLVLTIGIAAQLVCIGWFIRRFHTEAYQ